MLAQVVNVSSGCECCSRCRCWLRSRKLALVVNVSSGLRFECNTDSMVYKFVNNSYPAVMPSMSITFHFPVVFECRMFSVDTESR